MPGIDMSLEEMYNYMESTSFPKDFNCFWDEQLRKTAGAALELSVSEAEISHTERTKYYDTWFRIISLWELMVPQSRMMYRPPSVQFAAYDRIQGEKELKVYAKHMMLYS